MIVVKTQNTSQIYTMSHLKKNTYICPSCNHEITFGSYIPSICEECNKGIFNIEKLLDDSNDISKVNYYTNERI